VAVSYEHNNEPPPDLQLLAYQEGICPMELCSHLVDLFRLMVT
jgi:hypothetical protein